MTANGNDLPIAAVHFLKDGAIMIVSSLGVQTDTSIRMWSFIRFHILS
jgi:hypothetical protein